jgi:hypothetical protein
LEFKAIPQAFALILTNLGWAAIASGTVVVTRASAGEAGVRQFLFKKYGRSKAYSSKH